MLPAGVPHPELKPVMSIKSKVAQIKTIPAGDSVGYGRTFVAERDVEGNVIEGGNGVGSGGKLFDEVLDGNRVGLLVHCRHCSNFPVRLLGTGSQGATFENRSIPVVGVKWKGGTLRTGTNSNAGARGERTPFSRRVPGQRPRMAATAARVTATSTIVVRWLVRRRITGRSVKSPITLLV